MLVRVAFASFKTFQNTASPQGLSKLKGSLEEDPAVLGTFPFGKKVEAENCAGLGHSGATPRHLISVLLKMVFSLICWGTVEIIKAFILSGVVWMITWSVKTSL